LLIGGFRSGKATSDWQMEKDGFVGSPFFQILKLWIS